MFKSENNQITIEQMRKLDEEYTLVDIRDEISFEYGHIDGAKNIPLAKIKEDNSLLPKDKLVVLCCKSGQISDELAENLRDDGFNAVNLEGGYYSWLRSQFENEDYATDVEKASAKSSAKQFGADLLRRSLNTSLLSRTIKLPYAFRAARIQC